jgi:hypothetical protein
MWLSDPLRCQGEAPPLPWYRCPGRGGARLRLKRQRPGLCKAVVDPRRNRGDTNGLKGRRNEFLVFGRSRRSH